MCVFFIIYFFPFKPSLCENGEKYIPPHVRRAEEMADAGKREARERLKKHVQGLVNRCACITVTSPVYCLEMERLLQELNRKQGVGLWP